MVQVHQHASYKKIHLSRNVGSFLFFSKAFIALLIATAAFTLMGLKIKSMHVDAVALMMQQQQAANTVVSPPTIPVAAPQVNPPPVAAPQVNPAPAPVAPAAPAIPIQPLPVVPQPADPVANNPEPAPQQPDANPLPADPAPAQQAALRQRARR